MQFIQEDNWDSQIRDFAGCAKEKSAPKQPGRKIFKKTNGRGRSFRERQVLLLLLALLRKSKPDRVGGEVSPSPIPGSYFFLFSLGLVPWISSVATSFWTTPPQTASSVSHISPETIDQESWTLSIERPVPISHFVLLHWQKILVQKSAKSIFEASLRQPAPISCV